MDIPAARFACRAARLLSPLDFLVRTYPALLEIEGSDEMRREAIDFPPLPPEKSPSRCHVKLVNAPSSVSVTHTAAAGNCSFRKSPLGDHHQQPLTVEKLGRSYSHFCMIVPKIYT